MTEADFAALFHDHADSVVTILFGYFSVTSAFLVASYLTARTLPTTLTYVVVALYSFAALSLIGYCHRHSTLLLEIWEELVNRGAYWHTAVSEPSLVLPILNYTMVFSMLAIFFASIWYHFHAKTSDTDAP
ncbi:MAG: hypothetical protein ACI96M_004511 [Candidatus Azotimanducaceae bacterium]